MISGDQPGDFPEPGMRCMSGYYKEEWVEQNAPFQDIRPVIVQTIGHYSEMRLYALHLLDSSVNHLCAMVSSSSNFAHKRLKRPRC